MSWDQRTRRALCGLAAVALVLAGGCDDGNSSTSFQSNPSPQATAADIGLFTKIASAPARASYRGLRIHRLFHEDGTETQYREQVAGDGSGHFALDLVDWIEPQLSGSAAALAQQLVTMRGGLYYRYRGFAIRHLPSFMSNFSVLDVTEDMPDGATTVAGIDGVALEVVFSDPSVDGRHWELIVDPGSGLVLDAREYAEDQSLLSHTWFESLDVDPQDFDGIAWHLPDNQELELTEAESATVFDWGPLVPGLLPKGYQPSELASVSINDRLWAKRTFTNGVDVMFFLEADPEGSVNSLGDEVRSFQIDSWTVLDGHVVGHRVIALGRASEVELAGLLQSALEAE